MRGNHATECYPAGPAELGEESQQNNLMEVVRIWVIRDHDIGAGYNVLANDRSAGELPRLVYPHGIGGVTGGRLDAGDRRAAPLGQTRDSIGLLAWVLVAQLFPWHRC